MNLTDVAVLVEVTCHLPHFRRKVAEAGDVVSREFEADRDAVRAYKYLIHPDAIQPMRKVASALRNRVREMSAPWADGQRLMPKSFVGRLLDLQHDYISEFNNHKRYFLENYDRYVQEAKEKLGKLFDGLEYPTKEHLGKNISLDVVIFPIPSDSALEEMGNELGESIKKVAEQEVDRRCNKCIEDLTSRLKSLVRHAYEKLSKPRENERFREALFDHIKNLSEALIQLARERNLDVLKSLNELEIDLQLVKDETSGYRNEVAEKYKEIMKKMGWYNGGN